MLLKLTVLMLCVQAARLRAMLDTEPRGGRGEEVMGRLGEEPCALHSILLQVRDLGLGYESDEAVLFKYCGGTCPRPASNHHLTLAHLLQKGKLQRTEPWHDRPCCRPTHHEDTAFLDQHHRWHKLEKLSAGGCVCTG